MQKDFTLNVDIFDSEADWTFSGQGERKKKDGWFSSKRGQSVFVLYSPGS